MMKIDSISYLLPVPPDQPRTGPALFLAGSLCTLLELGAKGPSLAHRHRAATVDNFSAVSHLSDA